MSEEMRAKIMEVYDAIDNLRYFADEQDEKVPAELWDDMETVFYHIQSRV